jgi:hypothetical protein
VVKAYWDGLSVAERDRLIHEHPGLVGALDGVPCVDRDAANRIVLAEEVTTTRAEIDRLGPEPRRVLGEGSEYGSVENPEWTTWHDRLSGLQDRLGGLEAIRGRLYDQHPDPADPHHGFLLGLDTTGSGKAIVASGNPDTAKNVITYVPGTGAHLGNIGGDIHRSDLMVESADTASGSHDTASVTWVGYTAPQELTDAPSTDFARDAEPALQGFETGLRVTHDGDPSHNTIIGHSYGTTTVGYAMRDGGLPVDDVILVGSPGVGVEHATELGIDGAHVYAGTAANDPIQVARVDPTNPAYQAAADYLGPTPIGFPLVVGNVVDSLTGPDPRYVFGRDPVSPDFGASVLPTDPGRPMSDGGSHSQYWDRRSSSLAAIGQVAVGKVPHA